MGSKRISIALLVLVLSAVAATAKPDSALASRGMLVGIYDPVQPLISPDKTFATFTNLRVQILRMDLPWGAYVAKNKPTNGADPNDPAYNWDLYDQFVLNAKKNKMAVIFTIYGTPAWANGGQKLNRAPKKMSYLKNFAYAACRSTWSPDRPTSASWR